MKKVRQVHIDKFVSISLTRKARPLFALNTLTPLKFRGTYAVLIAPPNPPLLLTKLLKKKKEKQWDSVH